MFMYSGLFDLNFDALSSLVSILFGETLAFLLEIPPRTLLFKLSNVFPKICY